jgi:hypothetical protein
MRPRKVAPLPELTYEEFCSLLLYYTFGLRADKYAIRQYRNEEHGFGKTVKTPFSAVRHEWGLPDICYYLLEDGRVFDTPDQLYVAYMEKVCGIKP